MRGVTGSCTECERLRGYLLDANLDYVHATSQLMDIAMRIPVEDRDATDYASSTVALDNAAATYWNHCSRNSHDTG